MKIYDVRETKFSISQVNDLAVSQKVQTRAGSYRFLKNASLPQKAHIIRVEPDLRLLGEMIDVIHMGMTQHKLHRKSGQTARIRKEPLLFQRQVKKQRPLTAAYEIGVSAGRTWFNRERKGVAGKLPKTFRNLTMHDAHVSASPAKQPNTSSSIFLLI